MNVSESGLIKSSELVRAVAIMLIVLGHFDLFEYGGGGSLTLFMIAGLTYSKYVVPKMTTSPGDARILHLLLIIKIGVPAILYLALLQTMFSDAIDWKALFLVGNWVEPTDFAYWFIEVYVQINILLLLFSLSKYGSSVLSGLLKQSNALMLLLMSGLLALVAQFFWNTDHLYNRVPHALFWLFAAGILYGTAENIRHRIVFGVITLGIAFVLGSLPWLLACSIAFLAAFDRFWIGSLMKWFLEKIAAASLMIYLTHFQWQSLAKKIFPQDLVWVHFALALVGGVLLYAVYDRLWRAVRPILTLFIERIAVGGVSAGTTRP